MPFPLETIEQLQGFFWVLIRVSVLIFLMPLFGARNIPTLWKAGLSFVLAVLLTPVVPVPETLPTSIPELILGVASEVLMGFIAAFGVRIMFASVQFAGQIMSFQMGFSMARAIDPNTGVQSTALSQFLYLFTVLLFFAIDGHHLIIQAMAASFRLVPPNGASFPLSVSEAIVEIGGQMFVIGLKIAAPMMIALFLSNLCLGIVARTVPQVNILMIGFPINIGIGLMLFGLVLSNLSPFLVDLTRDMATAMMRLFRIM
ncbi:MAG: flagellar biosynthetic protein FliR [Desulfobacteraceae bacterium]|jgi:flagellar biosynthetic protein FliR